MESSLKYRCKFLSKIKLVIVFTILNLSFCCAFVENPSSLSEEDSLKLENKVDVSAKLDKIIESLERLEVNYAELARRVGGGDEQCARLRQQKHNSGSASRLIRLPTTNVVESSSKSAGVNQSDKLETPVGNGRDLFHFNKLSSESIGNSIPASSSPWTQNDESNLSDWFVSQSQVPINPMDEQRYLSISRQYETMFGSALDELSNVMREQLAGFRLGLNKLMGRSIDHSYNYNLILNQLALIKDECSLAASQTIQRLELQRQTEDYQENVSIGLDSTNSTKPIRTHSPDQVGALRSSDLSTLVRLVSQEVNSILMKQANIWPTSTGHQLEEILSRETQIVSRKLDEIGSISKQSAMFLTKLQTNFDSLALQLAAGRSPLFAPNSSSTSTSKLSKPSATDWTPPGQVVITYTNANSSSSQPTGAAENSDNHRALSGGNNKSTRWFSGSKVPGKQLSTIDVNITARQEQQQQLPERKCQSKTNLVTPSSCQQLHWAGANCSGQYYVFMRGLIRHVYCEMGAEGEPDQDGGWTVVLRRIDKSLEMSNNSAGLQTNAGQLTRNIFEQFKTSQVNFNLDWLNYKQGFGQLNEWSEFFIGLDLLHLLANGNESTEMQLDLLTSEGNELRIRCNQFQVDDEESRFRLLIGGCNDSVAAIPLERLNGSHFFTPDRAPGAIADQSGNCAEGPQVTPSPTWGWWVPGNGCVREELLPLTQPIGKQPELAGAQLHLHWPKWAHSREPMRRLIMKVRKSEK